LAIGSGRTCLKVSNYPLSSVRHILDNYNVNNNYYDYSCGWGVRMLGSLAEGVNYFGTDPNFVLTERLTTMGSLYNKYITPSQFDIRTQGSEIFIPEWENKMGLYLVLHHIIILKIIESVNNRLMIEIIMNGW